ncbi:RDD family protein [Tenacibaculum vairaonense]|uniref:RDD family protein n=1 Tax=Tenacibaculum vairaonense TaxID=3137860 RepID=UPI0031FB4AF4
MIYNQLSSILHKNKKFKRLFSMLLDHCFISLLIIPLILLELVLPLIKPTLLVYNKVLFYRIIVIYLNKDFFYTKSISKRILGFQVIDIKTNKPASKFQCLTRNLTIFLWPIEIIVSFFNSNRRIGDMIANTKIIPCHSQKLISLWVDIKLIKLDLDAFITLLVTFIYCYLLSFLW